LLASRHSSPLGAAALVSAPSCRRGRRPQPGDQRQHVDEHLQRHRNLGHLKGDVATVADDLGADLDQLMMLVKGRSTAFMARIS